MFPRIRKVWGNEPTHSQMGSHLIGSWSPSGLLIFQRMIVWIKTHWIEAVLFFKNILKLGCLKWARTSHLSTWNTNYGWKKGWESNYQFDYRPLKVKNCLSLLMFRWRDTYCWKALDKGYNFALKLTSIRGLHKTLWTSKAVKVPKQNDIQM
jgi:hypothetical protein